MHELLVKICGITTSSLANEASKLGADFIGIVFHPQSKRNVEIEEAKRIATATIEAGAKPVAVFVNQSAKEMQSICEQTNIRIVQLHGQTARLQHHLLPTDYTRFFVLNTPIKMSEALYTLDSDKDFILVDHAIPGQGKTIDWENFKYTLPFKWMLAGGLTPNNVANAINRLRPIGVDVSSGVEVAPGKKDRMLIEQFINRARGQYFG